MILRELYDFAIEKELVGDSVTADVYFQIVVHPGGSAHIECIAEEKIEGKKTFFVPRKVKIPREIGVTSAIRPRFLVGEPWYVFGWAREDDKKDPERILRTAESFRERTKSIRMAISEGTLEAAALDALLAFLAKPEKDRHAVVESAWKTCANQKLAVRISSLMYFVYAGDPESRPLHLLPEIARQWRETRQQQSSSLKIGRCLVTGREGPIVRLHDKIKGVTGVEGGAKLISFNEAAYLSHGLQGSDNAPISQDVADGYVSALNWLIANGHKVALSSDTCAVFWRSDAKDVGWLAELSNNPDGVRKMFEAHMTAEDFMLADPTAFTSIVLNGRTMGRIGIRSIARGTMSQISTNVRQYLDDIDIRRPFKDERRGYPMRAMMETLVPEKTNDKSLPSGLAAEFYQSVIWGRPFPRRIMDMAVRRGALEGTRANPSRIAARCSLIRACIRRIDPFTNCTKEDITVAINPKNREPAYLLGRYLAVAERIQAESTSGVNLSIGDRFFTLACTSPRRAFVQIEIMSKKHQRTLRGSQIGLLKILNQIWTLWGDRAYPETFTLEEQGLFQVGFNQQKSWFFTPKDERVDLFEKETSGDSLPACDSAATVQQEATAN